MQVRWSPEAADDFEQIVQYIRRDNSSAALRVARTIYERCGDLGQFPNLGRSGRVDGTRELTVGSTPFIVVYRVRSELDAVEIVSIVHAAQRWPRAAH
jgi:toxin ParE1/3/4